MRKINLLLDENVSLEMILKQLKQIKGIQVENKNFQKATIKDIYYECLLNKKKFLAKFTNLADEFLDDGLAEIEFIIEYAAEECFDKNVFEFAIRFVDENNIPEYFNEFHEIGENNNLFDLSEGLYFYYKHYDDNGNHIIVDPDKYFPYTFEIIKEI